MKHVLPRRYSPDNILFHAFYHSEVMRFVCSRCNESWKTPPKNHLCHPSYVTDLSTSASPPPAELIELAEKCFPLAIESLKGKHEWKWN